MMQKRINFQFSILATIFRTLFKTITFFFVRSTFITQMEPTYARMAFPCYDEPGFKTPFSIAIARNENENTRSNMPLKFTLRPR